MNNCLNCGKETKNKKFCSFSCYMIVSKKERRDKGIERKKQFPLNKCLHCENDILFASERERIPEYKKKKFCSHKCASIYNNIKRGNQLKIHKEICIFCGVNPVSKKATVFCSQQCSSRYNSQKKIDQFISGEYIVKTEKLPAFIRNFLLKQNDYKCTQCGWSGINIISGKSTLQIHHKDGNYKNNNIQNLDVLCPCCHSLTFSFAGCNRGNGRKNRREKYQMDKKSNISLV